MSSNARRSSLRVKWTAALLFVILVPLAIVALLTVRIQRRGLARAEKELEVAVVAEAASAIGDVLGEASETTHRVGLFLSDPRIGEDSRVELAEEALARSDALESIAIYDAKGELIDSIRHKGAPSATPGGAPSADKPAGALPSGLDRNGGGKWLENVNATGGRDLRFIEPMLAAGRPSGWVAGRLADGSLSRCVGQISESRFAADNRVLVVDANFRVLATQATGALAPGRDLTGQDIFASTALKGADWAKDFGMTTEFEDAERAPMVGTVRTMPERRWAVIARRPESEAFAALTEARRTFAVAIALLAVLGVVVGTWLARRTTAPIASLVDLTRAYGRREFTRRSDVRSNDELEELGDSLVQMSDALAAGEVEIARRATVEAGLSRYLPAEIARSIAEGRSSLALGGERKEVSVVFADVAAFTSFSERTSPESVVKFLNELFSILSEVVFRHGGMVDKFMGDCIMAVFTSDDARGHAQRAVAAAEDMQRFVETQAAAWKAEYDFDVRLGIGVASGPAIVGNLGSDQRMEYTAIGDTVNVASRLEALARPGQTLVTASVSRAASYAFRFNSLGSHVVRGKTEPVDVLELAE